MISNIWTKVPGILVWSSYASSQNISNAGFSNEFLDMQVLDWLEVAASVKTSSDFPATDSLKN